MSREEKRQGYKKRMYQMMQQSILLNDSILEKKKKTDRDDLDINLVTFMGFLISKYTSVKKYSLHVDQKET